MAEEVETESIETSGALVLILLFGFIILVIFKKPIFDFMRGKGKQKETKKQQEVPTAPRVDWTKMPTIGKKKDTKDTLQDSLRKIDEDLRGTKGNVKRVLSMVVEIKTDIYNKMNEYYNMSQDLDEKEAILRANLEALNISYASEDSQKRCPDCNAEMVLMAESNMYVCPKCRRSENAK